MREGPGGYWELRKVLFLLGSAAELRISWVAPGTWLVGGCLPLGAQLLCLCLRRSSLRCPRRQPAVEDGPPRPTWLQRHCELAP